MYICLVCENKEDTFLAKTFLDINLFLTSVEKSMFRVVAWTLCRDDYRLTEK